MNEASSEQMTGAKAQELQRAFDVFNQVSAELTQAYEGLQARVASLTAELAVANGELRKQYQEKEALSERLSLLVNALPAGVVVLDSGGRISEANPVATAMFGEEVVGAQWVELPASRLVAADAPDEWLLGERRVSIAESPLDSAGGRILLIHDITAAYELKANMERNQRLAAMGEMAASLAHQLRTPLATALLYSANLAQPELADSARVKFAGKAADQLKRLERLIQDVLLFARGESIGRDVFAISSLVAEVAQTMEPLCQAKGVQFAVSMEVGDSVIVGGRKAVSGALLNLLENALQASETGSASEPRVELSAQRNGGRVLLHVRDTGNGMTDEAQKRIFEPFFTTRGQGTGLGLAIALGVARAHGGSIEVTSTPGLGSEFVMNLPAGDAGSQGEE